jgi:hypothetical protein
VGEGNEPGGFERIFKGIRDTRDKRQEDGLSVAAEIRFCTDVTEREGNPVRETIQGSCGVRMANRSVQKNARHRSLKDRNARHQKRPAVQKSSIPAFQHSSIPAVQPTHRPH